MTKLIFEQKTIAAQAGQSVLDALLQAGIRIPYSCRQGVCHSCLIRVTAGRIPPQAQAGLSPGQKEQNLMLACSCIPHSDLSLQRYDISAERVRCRVASKRMLRPDILELKLDGRLQYRAGQYVNLWRDEMINRSYSLASLPSDRFLSFHIDVRPDGQFSRWASESLNIGDPVQLQGPMGECVYQSEPDTPLLLAAHRHRHRRADRHCPRCPRAGPPGPDSLSRLRPQLPVHVLESRTAKAGPSPQPV